MEIYRDLKSLPLVDRGAISIGKYDSMHIGHRKVLNVAQNIAKSEDRTFILISFANHPFSVVNPDSVPSQLSAEKFKMDFFRSIGCDILIYPNFSEKILSTERSDFLNFLTNRIKDIHFIQGYDFRFGLLGKGDVTYLGDYCWNHKETSRLTIVDRVSISNGEKVSSTLIREMLREGLIKEANRFLSREYFIEAVVIEGEHLGRTLDFPTINMFSESMQYPQDGVYLTRVEIDDIYDRNGDCSTFKGHGMTYVGSRTVKGYVKNVKLIETHIFNFSAMVYGKTARIYFLENIRGVIKFDSLESLRNQLMKDKMICENLLEEKCL